MEGEIKSDMNVCALCTTEMVNYGVGKCNHVICGKCAIRMRVKCQSKECAVCRQFLDRVFITKCRREFEELDQSKLILNEEFDLLFETKFEEKYFYDLMTCKCKVCGDKSRSMSALNRHYNNVHQLMFCDLCMNNLKHFPVEFPVYTGAELIAHRNWTPEAPGRGHPLCKFCDRRYYDADEWYKHLRRDHFMCHVCEREAANNTIKRTVFGDYESLLEHCRLAHFVCEEGPCSQQLFTNMFSSETELKAHRLSHHTLTKAEVRETRRLDVEVRFTADTADNQMRRDRGGPGSGRGGASGSSIRAYRKNRDPAPESSGLGLEMRNLPGMAQMLEINQTVEAQTAARANGEVPYEENPHDFPTLGGHVSKFNRPGISKSSPPVDKEKEGEKREEEEDLWAGPKPTVAKEVIDRVVETKNWQRITNPSSLTSDDFPALSKPAGKHGRVRGGGESAGVWQKNTSAPSRAVPQRDSGTKQQTRQVPVNNAEDFPSLGSSQKSPLSNLPWKPSASVPTRTSVTSAAPAPKFSNTEEFPTLGGRPGGVDSGGDQTALKNLPWQSLVKVSSSTKKQIPVSSEAHEHHKSRTHAHSHKNHSDVSFSRSPKDPIESSSFQGPSFAEEKVGRRLTATEAYESVASHEGQQGKIQLIKEVPSAMPKSTPNSGVFRMMDDDFPSVTRTSGNSLSTENQWRPSPMDHADLYFEISDDSKLNKNITKSYRQEFIAPNMESTSDFPSLGGGSRERKDPTTTASRNNPRESKKNKKGRKGRQGRQNDNKDIDEVEEDTTKGGPLSTPFSLGDLAASLLNAQYQEVPDMNARNQVLFDTLEEMLGSRFESFVQSSTRYRNREISARSYIDSLGELVSKMEVASFMPEMLVLLPDIGLQKSLMTVMEPELRRHLRECSTCGQIVTADDLPFHLSVH